MTRPCMRSTLLTLILQYEFSCQLPPDCLPTSSTDWRKVPYLPAATCATAPFPGGFTRFISCLLDPSRSSPWISSQRDSSVVHCPGWRQLGGEHRPSIRAGAATASTPQRKPHVCLSWPTNGVVSACWHHVDQRVRRTSERQPLLPSQCGL